MIVWVDGVFASPPLTSKTNNNSRKVGFLGEGRGENKKVNHCVRMYYDDAHDYDSDDIREAIRQRGLVRTVYVRK